MPKISGSSLQEHRKQTRERIFEALSTLMYERGFDAITLADIASAAGIGRTAMYNYYPDKESLLLAYTANESERYLTELRATLAEVDGPIERLEIYIRHQLRFLASHHMPPGPALRSLLSEQAYQQVSEHVSALEDILRGILLAAADGGAISIRDIDPMVPLIGACISGRNVRELDGRRLTEAIESTVAFVLRGVGAA